VLASLTDAALVMFDKNGRAERIVAPEFTATDDDATVEAIAAARQSVRSTGTQQKGASDSAGASPRATIKNQDKPTGRRG
jgi:hypothetical protein